MAINPDFRDLFAALNAAGAEYLLVGGYAVALHSQPRFTKDLDVFVRPSPDNAARVMAALQAFGAPVADLTVGDLERAGTVFQIGVAPNRIDVITSIDGVGFDEAWKNRTSTTYGGQSVPVIGRAELLKNKLASARPQDLLDADLLKKTSKRRPMSPYEVELITAIVRRHAASAVDCLNQLSGAEVEDTAPYCFRIFVTPKPTTSFSGLLAEGVAEDVDGSPISALVHLREGRLSVFEMFREDGLPLKQPPPAAAVR